MPANLENSAVATGLWSVFIPIPKKGNAKEWSNYCTTALISHGSKVMFTYPYGSEPLPGADCGRRQAGYSDTGKAQFSFQSQRKAMPKNVRITAEVHSSHTLVK